MIKAWQRIVFLLGVSLMALGAGGCTGDGEGRTGSPDGIGLGVIPKEASISVGEQITFSSPNGPSDCVHGKVYWLSEKRRVATIDEDTGKATGVAVGKAIVRAYCEGVPASPGSLSGPATLNVTGDIEVSPAKATIRVGKTQIFTADDGPCPDGVPLTWKSSNLKVASVNETSGRAEGIGAGIATITAECSAGNRTFSGTAELTVLALPAITVSPSEVTIGLDGGTQKFTATVSNGTCDNGTSPTWESLNPRIATIDAVSGVATGLEEGEATIEANCVVEGVRISGEATLGVTGLRMIVISPETARVDVGSTQTFLATVINGDCDDGDPFTWKSLDHDVATVSDTGVATGVSAGKTTISAGCGIEGIAMAAMAELFVGEPTITVDPGTASIALTGTQSFTATFSNGECDNQTSPTWESSETGVATIDATSGEATPVAGGVATITASCVSDGALVSGTADLTVTTEPAITVATDSPRIGVGGQSTFTATVSNGPCDSDADPAWESSDPGVATIAADVGTNLAQATGVATGMTTMTASCEINGALISGTADLTVGALLVSPADFTAPSLNGAGGTALTLQYSQDGGQTVTWSSSNELVATVDASTGLVTMVAAGTTTLTATETSASVSGSTGLTVIDGHLSEIALTPDGLGLPVDVPAGTTQAFTATGTFVGTATTTEDLTSDCNWTASGDGTVATVDAAGVVTGVAAGGPVDITCTYPLDPAHEATQDVTVP